MISLGPTSTSGFGNYYFQNAYNLKEYKEIVNSGKISNFSRICSQ